jgi:H+/gluconate symporter-like permease
MLAYITIFLASMCGYAGTPIWWAPVAAVGLASLSYAENYMLIRRGQELGFADEVTGTMLKSFGNALMATGAAYAFGMVLRVVAWPG